MAEELLGGVRVPPLRVSLHQERKGELLVHIEVGQERGEVNVAFAVNDAGEGKKIGNVARNLARVLARCVQVIGFHIWVRSFRHEIFFGQSCNFVAFRYCISERNIV